MATDAARAEAQTMLAFAPLGAAALALLAPARGTVLQADHIAQLSRAQTARQIHALTLPTRQARYGVDAYRLRYATVGVDGSPTTASGLLVLPRTRAHRLPTVSYTHGTMAAKADAPSRSLDSLAGASVLLFASAGYATVAPDYLGLGTGPGRHPYMHAQTEASAALDMLRAAHAVAPRMDTGTFVTGFSQGGQAAMGLGRILEDGADQRLSLKALAPMSGPYDIEHAQFPATLAGRVDPAVSNYYLSYAMLAWQPIYHVYDRTQDVWTAAWAPRIAGLYDGRHDDVAILKRLPQRLDQLFTPAFRARLAHPDGGLAAALRANDTTCDWHPRVPVRLYAARGDRQAAFANSQHCAAQAHVRLIDVGPVGHFPSTLRAAPRVLSWFDRLR
jgi:hypothetical protein